MIVISRPSPKGAINGSTPCGKFSVCSHTIFSPGGLSYEVQIVKEVGTAGVLLLFVKSALALF